jgi:hypothetical protein
VARRDSPCCWCSAIDSVGEVEDVIGFECGWCGDRGSAGV